MEFDWKKTSLVQCILFAIGYGVIISLCSTFFFRIVTFAFKIRTNFNFNVQNWMLIYSCGRFHISYFIYHSTLLIHLNSFSFSIMIFFLFCVNRKMTTCCIKNILSKWNNVIMKKKKQKTKKFGQQNVF